MNSNFIRRPYAIRAAIISEPIRRINFKFQLLPGLGHTLIKKKHFFLFEGFFPVSR